MPFILQFPHFGFCVSHFNYSGKGSDQQRSYITDMPTVVPFSRGRRHMLLLPGLFGSAFV
jgi:hypothetical protein